MPTEQRRERPERGERHRCARGVGRRRFAARPAQRGAEDGIAGELGDPHPAEERERAELEVAGAPAEHRGIERGHDRLAAAPLGPPHETLHHGVGPAPVQLEPARGVAHGGGALLHRHRGLAGEHERHAVRRRGARHGRGRPGGGPSRVRRSARGGAARGAAGRRARSRGRGRRRRATRGGRCASARTLAGWRGGCSRSRRRLPRRRIPRATSPRGPAPRAGPCRRGWPAGARLTPARSLGPRPARHRTRAPSRRARGPGHRR